MAQDGNGNTTEPPEGGNPFPTISENVVGAGLVQTTDARDLHRFLRVGRDFSNWIKARLDKYGFVENVDYVKADGLSSPNPASAKSRPQVLTEYHLTLDTAKEIAMVENNEQGRAARRYFIDCERRAKAGGINAKVVGGVTKGVIAKAIGELMPGILAEALTVTLPALVREQIGSRQHAVVGGVSAGQVIEMAGIAKHDRLRGLPSWVTHRLRRLHERRGIAVKLASLGSRTALVYDPLLCREWLATGGKAEIEKKVAERRGQGSLRLV